MQKVSQLDLEKRDLAEIIKQCAVRVSERISWKLACAHRSSSWCSIKWELGKSSVWMNKSIIVVITHRNNRTHWMRGILVRARHRVGPHRRDFLDDENDIKVSWWFWFVGWFRRWALCIWWLWLVSVVTSHTVTYNHVTSLQSLTHMHWSLYHCVCLIAHSLIPCPSL